jgi:hypothetical protein
MKLLQKYRKKRLYYPSDQSGGFVLIVSLVVLLLLTIIGISATNLTNVELQIAGNDKVHKDTFYRADAGTELGIRLAYDNAVCVQVQSGFDADGATPNIRTFANIRVEDLDFSIPGTLASTVPSDANRAVAFYPGGTIDDTLPHTNLLYQGETKYSPGSGLQMVSGYEGLGASAAAGGSHVEYDIISQHSGIQNSETVINLGWRLSTHIVNNASTQDCLDIYKN